MDLETTTGRCNACSWHETWSTTHAACCAASWHVYAKHPRLWREAIGEYRAPVDPKPGLVGNRLDSLGNEGYTCPVCQRTSFNPNDKREGYCGACKTWTGDCKAIVPVP